MSSVVSFSTAFARRRLPPRADRGRWSTAEFAELTRLFGTCLKRCAGAATFETGETDTGDPQFYVVGAGPDLPCIAFASRIGEDDGTVRYVVQDGRGEVVGEGETVAAAVDMAVSMLTPRSGPRRIMPYLVRSTALLLSC